MKPEKNLSEVRAVPQQPKENTGMVGRRNIRGKTVHRLEKSRAANKTGGLMNTKYKHIHFEIDEYWKTTLGSEKDVWVCYSNKPTSELGYISWYPAWKQYVVNFNVDAVFNQNCLVDIIDFIKQLGSN